MSLERYIADWHPQPVHTDDLLAPDSAQRLAATLDLDERFSTGTPLPPLWHWVYFADWPVTAALGPDGHPLAGHFLPPLPNRRRMFAGGRLSITAPLLLGTGALRRATVTDTRVKAGRTGELLFVTVRQEFHQGGELRLVEEQDIVYRSDHGSTTSFRRTTDPVPKSLAPWSVHPQTHPALLFRFSALTANAHRIHYDQDYACGVEGFPGLVVHGPLLALYMAELARAHGHLLRSFEFRLRNPVFVGDPIEVRGAPDGSAATLEVVSGGGVHASATASWA
jgi:3-methylfumaryl-CoA hydratase